MSSAYVANRCEAEDLETVFRWYRHAERAREESGDLYGREGKWVRTDGVSKAGCPE